jgi:predicted anti-sigma-YlaC factor YlaD
VSDADLSCRELVELVTDYLEARLTPVARARFEAHVSGCEGCRAHLEQLRQAIRVTGRVREEDVSEPARKALLAAFRGWKR